MSMSKKDFIALADVIKEHNASWDATFGVNSSRMRFSAEAINVLANFCKAQNSNFMRDRWLDYIAGNCGKNGGAIK